MTTETPTQEVPPAATPYTSPATSYLTPARPALSRREKTGAFWAGAVGFNVLTFGFGLVVLPLIVAVFGAFFSFLFTQAARNSDNLGTGFLAARGFFDSIDFGIVMIIGVVVFFVGLAIMTGALFASTAILRSHGIKRAWAVTWSGAGIAIVASWFIGWIPAVAIQLISATTARSGLDGFAGIATAGGVGMLLGIITTAVIGWLAWWWMAHAFRPAVTATTIDEQVQR
jgi:hypothetical protein